MSTPHLGALADNNLDDHAKDEQKFSLNVIDLSYTPPSSKFVRDQIEKALNFIAPLNIQWMFPNYRNIGKYSHHAELHRINFRADGGKITGIVGKLEERHELVRLLVGRNKHGTFSGDITMTGPTITANTDYIKNVGFVQRVSAAWFLILDLL
jgi:hypothetical protein